MTTVEARTIDSEEARVNEAIDKLLSEFPPSKTDVVAFLGAQFDLGLAWVHFAEGDGGLAVNPKHQKTINERIFEAGGPNPYYRNPIGYGMCGPTVEVWGSDEQKKRYLRPLFTGEEVWCQLFSEPGSGSDFAGLSGRGVRDGDEWIVNGQKVWTTLAHISRWGLLVFRTDPDVPKHAGLTAWVVDMQAPGVEVRPLRQMTGEAEFNEVYFTDVRIPDAERLGDPGAGWRVSLTTLMNERVSIGGAIAPKGSGAIGASGEGVAGHARRPARSGHEGRADEALDRGRGQSPHEPPGRSRPQDGHARSRRLDRQARVRGVEQAHLRVHDEPHGRQRHALRRVHDAPARARDGMPSTLQKAFLRSRANSIEGGTSEVMRNILGERVLGLPGDVRVDKDVSWSSVPRN